MADVPVVYVGPFDAVEICAVGADGAYFEIDGVVKGAAVSVPEWVAKGSPGFGGLLDQPDNWQAAKPAKTPKDEA